MYSSKPWTFLANEKKYIANISKPNRVHTVYIYFIKERETAYVIKKTEHTH